MPMRTSIGPGEATLSSPILTRLWILNCRRVFADRKCQPEQKPGDIASTAQEEDRVAEKVAVDVEHDSSNDDDFTSRSASEDGENEDSGGGGAALHPAETEMMEMLSAEAFEEDMRQSVVDRARKEGQDAIAADEHEEDVAPATPHIERLHKQMAHNGWMILHPPPGFHGLQPQYIRADGSSPQPNCYQFCEAANDLGLSDEPAQEAADQPADEHESLIIDRFSSEPEPRHYLGSAALLDGSSPLYMPPAAVARPTYHQSAWSPSSSEEAKECGETTSDEEHKSPTTDPSTPDKDAVKALHSIGEAINDLVKAFATFAADLEREESEEKEKEAAKAFEEHFAELQKDEDDDAQEDDTQNAYVGDLDDLALVEAYGDENYLQERATLPWDGRLETGKLLPDGAWNRLAIADGRLDPILR